MVFHLHAKDHKSMWNDKKGYMPDTKMSPKIKKIFDLDVKDHLKVVIIHHILEDGRTPS